MCIPYRGEFQNSTPRYLQIDYAEGFSHICSVTFWQKFHSLKLNIIILKIPNKISTNYFLLPYKLSCCDGFSTLKLGFDKFCSVVYKIIYNVNKHLRSVTEKTKVDLTKKFNCGKFLNIGKIHIIWLKMFVKKFCENKILHETSQK